MQHGNLIDVVLQLQQMTKVHLSKKQLPEKRLKARFRIRSVDGLAACAVILPWHNQTLTQVIHNERCKVRVKPTPPNKHK
jgi:hypothetical protein